MNHVGADVLICRRSRAPLCFRRMQISVELSIAWADQDSLPPLWFVRADG